jgi:hypothetical protein
MTAKAQMSARETPMVGFSNWATTGASAFIGTFKPELAKLVKSMQPVTNEMTT